MPCTPDTTCNFTDNADYGQPNLSTDPAVHYANMGWVGFVKLLIPRLNQSVGGNILRVTTADVNLSQEITMPDVIDGRIDRTAYQLGPKIVEGSFSLPVIADLPSGLVGDGCPNVTELTTAGQLLDTLWCWATARGSHGRLIHSDAKLTIRYANHAAFSFDTAIVNTFGMTITQGDSINLDLGIIGRARRPLNNPGFHVSNQGSDIANFLSPARVLTWNDATVTGVGGCSNPALLFRSNQVRDFNMEINNNADRFYTLNGSLFPMDVNVGQREITGSMTLMGFQDRLRQLAETNATRFTEKNEIRMAFYIGDDQFDDASGTFLNRDWDGGSPSGNPIWQKRLTGVVFRIEEVSMTNDLLETTVNWLALANDQENYEAFTPSSSCGFPAWV